MERIPISLLPLKSSGLRKFMFAFQKYTLKVPHVEFFCHSSGPQYYKEICFRFIEIPFPEHRGSSSFGESEKDPFSAIIISKILFPICAHHDDAQPQQHQACHHSRLEVDLAFGSAPRGKSPAAKRPESYIEVYSVKRRQKFKKHDRFSRKMKYR